MVFTICRSDGIHFPDGGTQQHQCPAPHLQPHGFSIFPGPHLHSRVPFPVVEVGALHALLHFLLHHHFPHLPGQGVAGPNLLCLSLLRHYQPVVHPDIVLHPFLVADDAIQADGVQLANDVGIAPWNHHSLLVFGRYSRLYRTI